MSDVATRPADGLRSEVAGHADLRTRPAFDRLARVALQSMVGVAVVLVWEFSSRTGIIDPVLYSSPTEIVGRIWDMLRGQPIFGRTVYTHLWLTIQAIVVGYVIGALGGIVVGFLLGRSRQLAKVFEPYILLFAAIPKIAIAPLFILTFGTGLASKIAIVTTEVFFILFYNTLRGVLGVAEDHINLARIMGADRRLIVRRIILPASLPAILAGFRMAVPFALIGVIIGEFIAASAGIGWLIRYSSASLDATGLFAAISYLLVVVVAMTWIASYVEARALPWRKGATGDGVAATRTSA